MATYGRLVVGRFDPNHVGVSHRLLAGAAGVPTKTNRLDSVCNLHGSVRAVTLLEAGGRNVRNCQPSTHALSFCTDIQPVLINSRCGVLLSSAPSCWKRLP